ncbi:MAG: biotin/lipoyl-containing protein [Vulcanimicrobiota bacterium]
MAKTNNGQSTRQVVKWAEALAQLVRESKMSELRLESGSQSLRLRRREDGEVVAPTPAPARSEARPGSSAPEDFGIPVNSNYVGVFRSSHPKTGKPMVKAQDTTETNQVLGWVECMGIRYEVVAPRAGTVAEVLVDDSEPVEFGQVLLVIQ